MMLVYYVGVCRDGSVYMPDFEHAFEVKYNKEITDTVRCVASMNGFARPIIEPEAVKRCRKFFGNKKFSMMTVGVLLSVQNQLRHSH